MGEREREREFSLAFQALLLTSCDIWANHYLPCISVSSSETNAQTKSLVSEPFYGDLGFQGRFGGESSGWGWGEIERG
jgi:hypothetical protein